MSDQRGLRIDFDSVCTAIADQYPQLASFFSRAVNRESADFKRLVESQLHVMLAADDSIVATTGADGETYYTRRRR